MPTLANRRQIAIVLAFAGALPSPIPLAWLHKFYLGQYLWGITYLVLAPTLLPQVACCLEGVWYLTQSDEGFVSRFPKAGAVLAGVAAETSVSSESSAQVASQVAIALRDLDQLRQEGLMTEYEFEQKRRQLLDRIA